jgi:hypothetical protein
MGHLVLARDPYISQVGRFPFVIREPLRKSFQLKLKQRRGADLLCNSTQCTRYSGSIAKSLIGTCGLILQQCGLTTRPLIQARTGAGAPSAESFSPQLFFE